MAGIAGGEVVEESGVAVDGSSSSSRPLRLVSCRTVDLSGSPGGGVCSIQVCEA